MQLRPFNSTRFAVDVARGDILSESGDVLFIGRPSGLQASRYEIDNPKLWKKIDVQLPSPTVLRYERNDLPWRHVFSIHYNPKSRDRLPLGGSDLAGLRYFKLRNNLEFLVLKVIKLTKLEGDIVIGLTPLSWRRPSVVAHAMVEALAGVFFCLRHNQELKSVRAVVRSIDQPVEIVEVFDRDYFRSFRYRLGWFPEVCDVWYAA